MVERLKVDGGNETQPSEIMFRWKQVFKNEARIIIFAVVVHLFKKIELIFCDSDSGILKIPTLDKTIMT